MPKLSVVIPTHRRPQTLRRCLEHIEMQTVRDEIEVIVVSDGHDKDSADVCERQNWKMPLKYFEIEKSQQGIARNKGVEEASGDIILFIGDDIFLHPDACEAHLKTHMTMNNKQQSTVNCQLSIVNCQFAVLGYTTWDPSLEINPVMKWLEKTGWQFGYSMISCFADDFIPSNIQERFTYTSHISLPRETAVKHPFREDATLYGWEDIEWGKRLKEQNIKLFYQPNAKAFHHHSITLEESLKRMETLGRSVRHFPDIGRKPKGIKFVGYRISAMLPTMSGRHRKAFLRGLKE